MAEQGAWVARVDPGTQEAMVERGAWAASMAGSPPPKFSWGDSSSQGGRLAAWSLRALESRTEPAGALESWTEPAGALESAVSEQAQEGAVSEQAQEGAVSE